MPMHSFNGPQLCSTPDNPHRTAPCCCEESWSWSREFYPIKVCDGIVSSFQIWDAINTQMRVHVYNPEIDWVLRVTTVWQALPWHNPSTTYVDLNLVVISLYHRLLNYPNFLDNAFVQEKAPYDNFMSIRASGPKSCILYQGGGCTSDKAIGLRLRIVLRLPTFTHMMYGLSGQTRP